MAWWSSVSNVSKLAHTALKEAQRKLDKVLDIEEDASQLSSNSHVYFDFDGNAFNSVESAKIFPKLTTSLDTPTPKCDRPDSSSFSSGLMSESECLDVSLEAAVHEEEKPQSALSSSTTTTDQGNTCSSMKLSTSETLTADIPPHSKSHLSEEEDDATSKEIEKTMEESIKGGVECSLESLPKEVASSLLKSRVDDESGGTTTSSEIEVISTCTSVYDDSFSHQNTLSPRAYLDANASVDVLYQKLSGMTKLLEAREAKLVEICRSNLSLQEVNEFLHTKLEEAGLPHDFNTSDLQSLTDEFTERLAKAEKRLQAATRERDELKSQLASATRSIESNLKRVYCEQENALKSRCATLESTLAEKETQLADLLAEGNRMAQEQLKTNNLVKTLRSKTKTLESEKLKIGNNLTKAQTEIDSLKSDLSILRESESKLQESFNQLTRKNLKLEKEVSDFKAELDASKEKAEALNRAKLALESKLLESAEGLASAQAALNESQARRDAIRDVEEEQQSLRDEVSTLRAQLEEARVAASRQKVEADQRLHLVRQEVDHYREQLAESESRLQSLGEAATSVAKPLLQQIQSLQSKLNDQSKEFEKTEHSLLSQINDLKKRLEVVEHIDRQSMDRLKEAEVAANALRLELALERENSTRLHDKIAKYNLQASADKGELENTSSSSLCLERGSKTSKKSFGPVVRGDWAGFSHSRRQNASSPFDRVLLSLHQPTLAFGFHVCRISLHSELDSLHQQIAALEDSRDSANSALSAEREEVLNLRAELSKTKSELANARAVSPLHTTAVAATSYSPTPSEVRSQRHSSFSSSSDILAVTLPEQPSPSSPSLPRPSATPTGHFASSLSFLQRQSVGHCEKFVCKRDVFFGGQVYLGLDYFSICYKPPNLRRTKGRMAEIDFCHSASCCDYGTVCC
ncbi:unnamed protein product [Rodentolepis nana]|uniref:TMF_TATA_bd domain-containing protein n=1 Tax=Rodentolepis nana TaxID=102285 RepID=A0A158QIS8_RODNA|nr:unnamed protein product [Rodentolepis nana]